MEKVVRRAAKCFVIQENKIVAIQYRIQNRKAGYYDIPGGKIEVGETAKEAAIRETQEETGVIVKTLVPKGNIIVEYPNRIFYFSCFLAEEWEKDIRDKEENMTKWIDMNELVQQEKILSNILILNLSFRKEWLQSNTIFEMKIQVEENETINSLEYEIRRIKNEGNDY